MKKNPASYEIVVAYFEMFGHEEFYAPLWRATKGMPLYHRLLAVGGSQLWQKKRGELELNHFYVLNLRVPRGFLKMFTIRIREFGTL